MDKLISVKLAAIAVAIAMLATAAVVITAMGGVGHTGVCPPVRSQRSADKKLESGTYGPPSGQGF